MTLSSALVIGCYALLMIAIALLMDNIRLRRYTRKQFVTNQEHATLYQHYASAQQQAASMAQQYIDAPKLISIHRDGRLNVFTFARGDDFFSIETMGLLSDDVDGWRKQAGIKSE